MTDQALAEKIAREFLGWECEMTVGMGWVTGTRSGTTAPSLTSWEFFGAMWEECGRRGWGYNSYDDGLFIYGKGIPDDRIVMLELAFDSSPIKALALAVSEALDA